MTEAEFITEASEALRLSSTPQQAARRVYAACKKFAKAQGMKPEIECVMRSPLQSAKFNGTKHWYVGFEAGPYDWAVDVSDHPSSKVWAEPYYGFDLYFYAKGE